jgi:hydrogenase maturation protease
MAEPLPTDRHVVVMGYGSSIRGDDAVGAIVADQLIDELDSTRVTVHSRHILTAELVADLQGSSLAIFLDAAADGPDGEVLCRKVEADSKANVSMAHYLDPREMLAWCRDLYGRSPEAFLVSVRAVETDYGYCELSPSVAAAIEPMKRKVVELLERHLSESI